MKTPFAAAAVLVALYAMPVLAAPTFNCRTARLPAEKVVCANGDLGAMDRRVSRLYFDALERARDVSDDNAVRTVRNSQRGFIVERNGCGWEYSCVRDAYRNQARTLRRFMRQLD